MYYGQHTQTGEKTIAFHFYHNVLFEVEELCWEDCEWVLYWSNPDGSRTQEAEFPCTYSFRYGVEAHNCELTANRPDSLCPLHAGDED